MEMLKTLGKLALFFMFFFLSLLASAQSDTGEYKCYYKVGAPCPDFTFTKVTNFAKNKVSLSDFRNKWLILDFWHKDCSACIKSFAKTNQEQKEFKDNIQFLLIGLQDKEQIVNALFENLRKRMTLQLPCAFDSSLLEKQIFELAHGMPFVVIIDPNGIVRGSGPTLEGIDLHELTQKNMPTLRDYYRERWEKYHKLNYNYAKPYLVNGNGGADSNFLFRSILSKWTPSDPVSINNYMRNGRFEVLGANNLSTLYLFAFLGTDHLGATDPIYGQYWPKAVIDVRDSSLFQGDRKTGRNMYSYSLTIPPSKAAPEKIKHIMQQDLQNYFGYHAQFEIRKMPYWRLIATDEAREKLPTGKNMSSFASVKAKGMDWQVHDIVDRDMKYFVSMVARYSSIEGEGTPIIDETGIQGNIDIHLDFNPFDLDSVLKCLHEYGLDLIKEEKEMKVLVIRD